ncbi:hypothetical protein ACL02S_11565 [Nocardia sp. 004]|uniref:hypothetical protein n=1 Tax=Nocardia sp. 004 TaxID=3385978 RepID=UPI0039A28F56
MRSAVIAAFVGATVLTGSTGTAAAGLDLPSTPESGSASSGSVSGLAITGSAESGKLLCAATGSAFALLGDAYLNCDILNP